MIIAFCEVRLQFDSQNHVSTLDAQHRGGGGYRSIHLTAIALRSDRG